MSIERDHQQRIIGLGLCHYNSCGKAIQDYEPLEVLGEGSYGCVWKAINKHSGDVVAIKKLKDFTCSSWKECMNLREVKALRGVGDHPNIVKLKQLIMEDNVLYLVMECMDMTLTQFMRNRVKKFADSDEVRAVVIQLFQALAHMHQSGYFHRDLKPDNILPWICGRWGLSWRVVHFNAFVSRVQFGGSMWKICRVIGTPTEETWEEGLYYAQEVLNFEFPKKYDGVDKLAELVPNADEDAIALIRWLCSWDDLKRPTAMEALRHPFFTSHYIIPKSIVTRAPKSSRAASSAKTRNTKLYLSQFKKARVV
ncbi:hypothetical protein Scep_026500 [Stephania cephalantha]|uniref:Protein kinase domain-containing protein n=1 Tax=Stephania cephalantha TaxID=152367 RepID=A0AAP0EK92_9MAGN